MVDKPERPRPALEHQRVSVALHEYARVVPGGHRKRTWLVRVEDAWVPALRAPGAAVERLDPGVGTVWEHLIRLQLAVGSELVRVDSEPGPRARKDALSYLEHGARDAARRVNRAVFRVLNNGELRAADGVVGPPRDG